MDRLPPLALTVGYTNNHNGYDFRIFESTNENVLQLKADAVGFAWVTFRAHYEYGDRTGSGLDEASLDRRSASSRSCGTTISRTARATGSSARWTSCRPKR